MEAPAAGIVLVVPAALASVAPGTPAGTRGKYTLAVVVSAAPRFA